MPVVVGSDPTQTELLWTAVNIGFNLVLFSKRRKVIAKKHPNLGFSYILFSVFSRIHFSNFTQSCQVLQQVILEALRGFQSDYVATFANATVEKVEDWVEILDEIDSITTVRFFVMIIGYGLFLRMLSISL